MRGPGYRTTYVVRCDCGCYHSCASKRYALEQARGHAKQTGHTCEVERYPLPYLNKVEVRPE